MKGEPLPISAGRSPRIESKRPWTPEDREPREPSTFERKYFEHAAVRYMGPTVERDQFTQLLERQKGLDAVAVELTDARAAHADWERDFAIRMEYTNEAQRELGDESTAGTMMEPELRRLKALRTRDGKFAQQSEEQLGLLEAKQEELVGRLRALEAERAELLPATAFIAEMVKESGRFEGLDGVLKRHEALRLAESLALEMGEEELRQLDLPALRSRRAKLLADVRTLRDEVRDLRGQETRSRLADAKERERHDGRLAVLARLRAAIRNLAAEAVSGGFDNDSVPAQMKVIRDGVQDRRYLLEALRAMNQKQSTPVRTPRGMSARSKPK